MIRDRRRGAVPLFGGVQRARNGAAQYSISDTGTLVYVSSSQPARTTTGVLALVDWDGTVQRLRVPPRRYRNPRVSPNGRELAVQILEDDGQSDVWIYDLTEQFEMRRLTQAGRNTSPIWTPNGEEITFGSDRDGSWAIYSQRADGRSIAERLADGGGEQTVSPAVVVDRRHDAGLCRRGRHGRLGARAQRHAESVAATPAIQVMSSSSMTSRPPASSGQASRPREAGSLTARWCAAAAAAAPRCSEPGSSRSREPASGTN